MNAHSPVLVTEADILQALPVMTYDEIRAASGWSRGRIYGLALKHGARKTEARIRERAAERKARQLEVFPYVEFLVGDYHEELRYRNIMNLYNRIWYDKNHNAVFAKKTAQWKGMNIQPFDSLVFFASSLPITYVLIRIPHFAF